MKTRENLYNEEIGAFEDASGCGLVAVLAVFIALIEIGLVYGVITIIKML